MTHAEALRDILDGAGTPAKATLLRAVVNALDFTLSQVEIAKLLHYPDPFSANSILGKLGAQVYERTGRVHPDGFLPGQFQTHTVIAVRGTSRDGSYAWALREEMVKALSELGFGSEADALKLPEEIAASVGALYPEGALRQIFVNAYERSPQARLDCLTKYGYDCFCCGLNMQEHYGLEKPFVHVHHLKPLNEIGGEYEVNGVMDLRPLCPNCHAVLHLGNPPLAVDVLRKRRMKTAACCEVTFRELSLPTGVVVSSDVIHATYN